VFRGQYRISQENFSWTEGIGRGFSFAEGEVFFTLSILNINLEGFPRIWK
jgi:hypothetical protein